MQDLDKAYRDGSTRQFQFTTKGEGTIFTSTAGNTIAWTAAGAVTLAGSEKPDFSTDQFKRGDIVTAGSAKVVIRSISADGTTVSVGKIPGGTLAVQAAAQFTISRPDIRQGPFTARVAQFGALSSAAGSNQTSTTVLQPNSILPLPTPV